MSCMQNTVEYTEWPGDLFVRGLSEQSAREDVAGGQNRAGRTRMFLTTYATYCGTSEIPPEFNRWCGLEAKIVLGALAQ